MTKTIAVLSSLCIFGASAFAEADREKPNPWLDCGIGAMAFPGDEHEPWAAVSNVTWDWGTTAVTSAVSSPDSCSGLSNVAMAAFVQTTFASLETDLAKGQGETLDALANVAGVEDAETFKTELRTEYASLVASGEADARQLYLAAEAISQG